jgi:carbonic anhydrase
MRKLCCLIALGAAFCLPDRTAHAESGYQPPTSWGSMQETYWNALEGDKKNCGVAPQSPINLQLPALSSGMLRPIEFKYSSSASDLVLVNNGHTVELLLAAKMYYGGGEARELAKDDPPSVPGDNSVGTKAQDTAPGFNRDYLLQNLHFHHPSEHLVNDKRYALEMHLVHVAPDPLERVVVAVLFELGENDNPDLKALFDLIETKTLFEKDKWGKLSLGGANLAAVLPKDRSYAKYDGSLTTPECNTGVTWVVLTTPVSISQKQLDQFKRAIRYDFVGTPVNARPKQPDQPVRFYQDHLPAEYCRFVGNQNPSTTLSCAMQTMNGWTESARSNPSIDPGYGEYPRFMADVNADGRPDYCRFVGYDRNRPRLSCAAAGLDSFMDGFADSADGIDRGYTNMPSWMADVNGDGRADYCRFTSSPIRLACSLVQDYSITPLTVESAPDVDLGQSGMPRMLGDVNGDGKADFCRVVVVDGQFTCALADGVTFAGVTIKNAGFQGPAGGDVGRGDLPSYLADVDGDGKADYCRFIGGSGTNPQSFRCSLSDGKSFGKGDISQDWASDSFGWLQTTSGLVWTGDYVGRYFGYNSYMVDINGDGRADVCWLQPALNFAREMQPSYLLCAVFNGQKFVQQVIKQDFDAGYEQFRIVVNGR